MLTRNAIGCGCSRSGAICAKRFKSGTVPFVSKATGVALARLAARLMAGERIADLNLVEDPPVAGVAVKEAAFPFNRFEVDIILGPEMRSTGEVMGFDDSFGMAFAKAQASAYNDLPDEGGTLVVTVNKTDKEEVAPLLVDFAKLGFRILATRGTLRFLPLRPRTHTAPQNHPAPLGLYPDPLCI